MTTLSTFYPPDTTYFYGYPSGATSGFYNTVPPRIEELVSARPLVCAGPTMRIVSCAAAVRSDILRILRDLGVPLIGNDQILSLPDSIDVTLEGEPRNSAIRSALASLLTDRSLIMAQPFPDTELPNTYQFPAERTIFLNDKRNMPSFIPRAYLPETYALYSRGADFACDTRTFGSCVVKIASSSSGDGVMVCKDAGELFTAREKFSRIESPILIQEYIPSQENLCVQFGIPSDSTKPPEIIGATKQLTTRTGEFLGGIIDPRLEIPPGVSNALLAEVLPIVRSMGWYGVGAIDTLITEDGRFFFIDPNFRMNATTAFLLQSRNGAIQRPMAAMSATFDGTTEDLRRLAEIGTTSQILNIIAMTRGASGFAMSSALLFDQEETLRENALALRACGVKSAVINVLT